MRRNVPPATSQYQTGACLTPIRRSTISDYRNSVGGSDFVKQFWLILLLLLGYSGVQAQTVTLTDDFNGTAPNPGIWSYALSGDPGLTTEVVNGELRISGINTVTDPNSWLGGGLHSKTYLHNGRFDASVSFKSPSRGSIGLIYLCIRSTDGFQAGVGFWGEYRLQMWNPTTFIGLVPAFGDETSTYHRMSMSYSQGLIIAMIDGQTIGTYSVTMPDVYFELIYASNSSGQSIDVQFDDFLAHVNTIVPVLCSPIFEAQRDVALDFLWRKVESATSYQIQISSDSLFSWLAIDDSTVADTSKQVGNLVYGTQYYWRVSAKSSDGTRSPYSWTGTFTTFGAPTVDMPLLFTKLVKGYSQLFVMDRSFSSQAQLTTGSTNHNQPRWSPNGSRILYARDNEVVGLTDIWVMNADGTGKSRVTYAGADGARNASWHINGRDIIYEWGASALEQNIHIVSQNGTGDRLLFGIPGDKVTQPLMHPLDSNLVLYAYDAGNWTFNKEVRLRSLNNGANEVLVPNDGLSDLWFAFDLSGSHLLWSDVNQSGLMQLRKLDMVTKNVSLPIASGTNVLYQGVFQNDYTMYVLVCDLAGSRIIKCDSSGKNQVLLFASTDTLQWIDFKKDAQPGMTFYDDFSNLDNWTLYGDPLPVWLGSIYGRAGIFDNNGDPSYNSGAISKQTFDISQGFALEADVYLDFYDLTGCWAGAAIGVANPTIQSGGDYAPYLSFNITADGDACWGSPELLRRHAYFNGGYQADTGWVNLWDMEHLTDSLTFRADQYIRGWHRLKIVVNPNRIPSFYIDNTPIYGGTAPVGSSVMSTPRSIWLGDRSSGSAGKAYHDNLSLGPPPAATIQFNNALAMAGSTPVGTIKWDSLVVTNTGGAVVDLLCSSSNPGVFQVPSGSISIPVGTSRAIPVSFVPPDTGHFVGELYLTHTALGSPDTVAIEGQAYQPVTLTTPNDLASKESTMVQFAWTSTGGATSYQLQVSTNPRFSWCAVNDSALTLPSRTISSLSHNTVYFWRVRAVGPWGKAGFTPPRRFATVGSWAFPTGSVVDFPSSPSQSSEYKLVGVPGSERILIGSILTGSQLKDWRVFRDNGGSPPNHLTELPPESTFVPGEGYWLLKKGPLTFSRSAVMPRLDTLGTYAIVIRPGWNIISMPFDRSVRWQLIQAENVGISEPLFTYNAGYLQDTLFQPFRGYYFFNNTTGTTLEIPYPFAGRSLPKQTAPAVDWALCLGLETGNTMDVENHIGISREARIGRDNMDHHKPPAFSDRAALSFIRPDWDSIYSAFCSDFRPEIGKGQSWDFTVNVPEQTVARIRLNGIEALDPDWDIFLVNLDNSQPVDCRTLDAYEYHPTRPQSQFRLLIGTKGFVAEELKKLVPTEFSLSQNYPNPFNPSTSISFSVPWVSPLRLEIVSLLGQKVRVLAEGVYQPGTFTAIWDGNNDEGQQCASGVYFCRFNAFGQAKFVKKLLLMR